MKTLTIAFAALLAGVSAATILRAQVDEPAVETGQAGGDAAAAAKADAASDAWTYGRVISTLEAGRTVMDDASFDRVSGIRVVNLSELDGEADVPALDTALAADESDVVDLRARVRAAPTLFDALRGSGYQIDRLVGWAFEENGTLTFLYDDRS